MFSKIEITGNIEVVTGMHIGASDSFAAIGAIDSPVIKDTVSGYPILPGSSFKGKMRALLAKQYNENHMNECSDDHEKITRLFGTSRQKSTGYPQKSKLIFSDMIISNMDELKTIGLDSATEIKEENSINRVTGVANPRILERVIRGTVFPLQIIYNVDDESEVCEDFEVIADGLKLLQYDYIGGHGSRGYGKIRFSKLAVDVVIGEVSEDILERCRELLEEV